MKARRSKYSLFLAIGTLVLFSPFVVRAQSSSAINIGDVMWETAAVVVPASMTGDTDGSVTTAKRYYYFGQEGKVTAITVFSKSDGTETKLSGDLIVDGAGNDRYEDRLRYKTVPTQPKETSSERTGTYTIKRKTLTFEIPDSHAVTATIYDDRIEGILTNQESGKKGEWIVTKRPPKKN